MKRPSLLLISILLFTFAASILYTGISYSYADPTDQTRIEQTLISLIPIAMIASAVALFSIWIAGLICMLLNGNLSATDKIVWALVIIFTNFIGSIIYFLVIPFYRSDTQISSKKAEQGAAANPYPLRS